MWAEKTRELEDARELIEVLRVKIQRLEELVVIKDRKLECFLAERAMHQAG